MKCKKKKMKKYDIAFGLEARKNNIEFEIEKQGREYKLVFHHFGKNEIYVEVNYCENLKQAKSRLEDLMIIYEKK